MIQNVHHASRGQASGAPSARLKMNGRNPQMKNVVNTRAFSTPCIDTL